MPSVIVTLKCETSYVCGNVLFIRKLVGRVLSLVFRNGTRVPGEEILGLGTWHKLSSMHPSPLLFCCTKYSMLFSPTPSANIIPPLKVCSLSGMAKLLPH